MTAVVDSSGWLEYFADGPNADHFAPPIEAPDDLLVPVITVYEVFKKIAREHDEGSALRAVALMQRSELIDVTAPLCLSAARLSLDHGLPMADAIILASSRRAEAVLWTQDADFEGLEGVRYIPG